MSPRASAELIALALTLAYSFACSVIDGNCLSVAEEVGAPGWFELPAKANADIDDCVRYLELRGLLERDANRPDWVAMRDESEATA